MSAAPKLQAVTDTVAIRGREERAATEEVETDLLGAFLEGGEIPAPVAAILGDGLAFDHPGRRLIYQTMRALQDAGAPVSLPALANELDANGELEPLGGMRVLARLGGPDVPIIHLAYYARQIVANYHRRNLRLLHADAAKAPEDRAAELRERIRQTEEALSELEIQSTARDTDACIYVGRDRYAELAARPEPAWLVPSLLRPGKATVLGGSPFTGKTFFTLQVTSSLAAGIPAWEGLEAVAGPVVFLGFDPHCTVEDLARRLHWLDSGPHRRGTTPGSWQDTLALVGHSDTEGAFPVDRYRLHTEGTERIALELLRPLEQRMGALGCIVVDTLSTALPEGCDENDSASMNAAMLRLGQLGLDFGAAVLVLHHPTKSAGSGAAGSGGKATFNSWDPNAYFRGSSAISGAAGVLGGLWAPGAHPQYRALTTWANTGRKQRWWFEVAEPERAATGCIDYWLPTDEPPGGDELDPEALVERLALIFPDPTAPASRNAAALALAGRKSGDPSGAAKAKADATLQWASDEGYVVRPDGRKYRLTPSGAEACESVRG